MRQPQRRWPEPLAAGARVALVAPAGPLRGRSDVERAEQNVRRLGWEPVVGAHVLRRDGYFAGSDAERLADLNGALAARNIDGVWCLRGGYGVMRLLPQVDYDGLRVRPRPLLGFSDITALHAAVGRRAGIVTFHGPVARATIGDWSASAIVGALSLGVPVCGVAPDARTVRDGLAEGVLAGGNLALLAALTGTPYMPELRDTILVLEDVNEAVYRVDRMLRQLLLAGVLDGVRGLVFGQFTNCPAEGDDGARPLADVLEEFAALLDVPCIAGAPVGHVDEQWTLPLGALATLDAGARRLDVVAGSSSVAASNTHQPLIEESL